MGKVYVGGMQGGSSDPEYTAKVEEYKKYVDNHRANVKKVYEEKFKDKEYDFSKINISNSEFRSTVLKIAEDIENHDISKYSDEEFYPYRRIFYPTSKEVNQGKSEEDNEAFEAAWVHHYLNNNHHPEYWRHVDQFGNVTEEVQNQQVDIPLYAILHMLCDWGAMSLQHGNSNPYQWWINSADKERSTMNEETIKLISELIDVIWPS